MKKIQLYYGVRCNDGRDEWYICQDMVHYACIVKEGSRRYTYDQTSVEHAGETFSSIREAAESYGTVTNSIFVQRLIRLWDIYISTPFWDAVWAVYYAFQKDDE